MRGNADNRITDVETSADAQNWHHDARYFYYPHGPLQRVELGEHLVQGTDYAYTLQGWLKGINGDRLNPTTDMGRDGDATVVGNPNLLTGRDAYALSLGYYGDNDYKAIASSYDSDSPANIAQRPFAPIGSGGTMNTEHTPLYNGNIAHTVNTLQHFGLWDATNGDQGQVLAMVYRYDQLNRLRTARGVIGLGNTNTWNGVNDAGPNEDNRYRSEYTYDANGNIETVERYDADGTGHYDSFAYHYHTNGGRKQQNRLYELIDDATMNTGFDIVTTATGFDNTSNGVNVNNNYGYDALGNLVRDDREDIELIHWTVAGKVDSIQRPSASSRSPLKFRYGASGQRVSKQVGDFYCTDPGAYREHYIRDAQGNIMATYRYTNSGSASLKLNERSLYGSSRLGSLRKEVELHTLASFDPASANPVQQVDLNYELTDHLGNVCAVVTGRLLDGNGGGTAKQAELVSGQGYEAFGSLLPGRNYSSYSYRFAFQGQEKDDEMHGATGTSYAFEYRIHDARIGRFLSIDPLASKYAYNSPYAFSENRLIDAFELEGLECVKLSDGSEINTGPATMDSQIDAFESSEQAKAGAYVTEWADGTQGLRPLEVRPELPSMPIPTGEGPAAQVKNYGQLSDGLVNVVKDIGFSETHRTRYGEIRTDVFTRVESNSFVTNESKPLLRIHNDVKDKTSFALTATMGPIALQYGPGSSSLTMSVGESKYNFGFSETRGLTWGATRSAGSYSLGWNQSYKLTSDGASRLRGDMTVVGAAATLVLFPELAPVVAPTLAK